MKFGVLCCVVVVLLMSVLVVGQEDGVSCADDGVQEKCQTYNKVKNGDSVTSKEFSTFISDAGENAQTEIDNLVSDVDFNGKDILSGLLGGAELSNENKAKVIKGLGSAYATAGEGSVVKSVVNDIMTGFIRGGEDSGPVFDFGSMDISKSGISVTSADESGFSGLEIMPEGAKEPLRVPSTNHPKNLEKISLGEKTINYANSETKGENVLAVGDSSYVQSGGEGSDLWKIRGAKRFGGKDLEEGYELAVGFPSGGQQSDSAGNVGKVDIKNGEIRTQGNAGVQLIKAGEGDKKSALAMSGKGDAFASFNLLDSGIVKVAEGKGSLTFSPSGEKSSNDLKMGFDVKDGEGPIFDFHGSLESLAEEGDSDYGKQLSFKHEFSSSGGFEGYEVMGNVEKLDGLDFELSKDVKIEGEINTKRGLVASGDEPAEGEEAPASKVMWDGSVGTGKFKVDDGNIYSSTHSASEAAVTTATGQQIASNQLNVPVSQGGGGIVKANVNGKDGYYYSVPGVPGGLLPVESLASGTPIGVNPAVEGSGYTPVTLGGGEATSFYTDPNGGLVYQGINGQFYAAPPALVIPNGYGPISGNTNTQGYTQQGTYSRYNSRGGLALVAGQPIRNVLRIGANVVTAPFRFFRNRQPIRTFFRNGGFFRRGCFRGRCY